MRSVFSNFILNRVKVAFFFNGTFLNVFLNIFYGDYILYMLTKTHIFVNGKISTITNKNKIFFDDFIEFRFFLFFKNVILKFCFFFIVCDNTDFFILNKKTNVSVIDECCTFLHNLFYIYPQLIYIPKQGVVHRLDKFSIGLLIIAKTRFSFFRLSKFPLVIMYFLFVLIIHSINTLFLFIVLLDTFITLH